MSQLSTRLRADARLSEHSKKTLVGSEILCYLYSNDIVYQILIFINFVHITFKDDFSYATIAHVYFSMRGWG